MQPGISFRVALGSEAPARFGRGSFFLAPPFCRRDLIPQPHGTYGYESCAPPAARNFWPLCRHRYSFRARSPAAHFADGACFHDSPIVGDDSCRANHSDFRIGRLKPGETKQIRGKLYIVPADVSALVARCEKDFPEPVRVPQVGLSLTRSSVI
jgi:hypothetical protein